MKQTLQHLATILFAASCLTVSPVAKAQTLLTNGLVSYYPFNGNANDELGLHHGEVTGATLTVDMFGRTNAAYSFSGVGTFVGLPEAAAPDSQDFTLSVWFLTRTLPRTAAFLVSKGQNNLELHLKPDGGLRFLPRVASGFWDTPSKTITSNTWYHLVAVFNPSENEVKLYLNNSEIAMAGPELVKADADSNLPIRLGLRIGSTSSVDKTYPLDGVLDNFRIYDHALSEEAVAQVYAFEAAPFLPLEIEFASVRLKWPSEAGAVYEVEYSTAFQDWTFLIRLGGTATLLSTRTRLRR